MDLAEFKAQVGNDVGKAFSLAAEVHGVDPTLIGKVQKAESGGDQSAVSPKGAIGRMQLMPGTAADLGVNPHDEIENIYGGVKYLADQRKEFGTDELALAAYNAGPAAVRKYGGVPPYKETQNYVAGIMGDGAAAATIGAAVGAGGGDVTKGYAARREATDAATNDALVQLFQGLGRPAPENYQPKSVDERLKELEISPAPFDLNAPIPPEVAAGIPKAGGVANTPVVAPMGVNALSHAVFDPNFAAVANRLPLEALNGFARIIEEGLNLPQRLVTGKGAPHTLTKITGWLKDVGSPQEQIDQASPVTKFMGSLLGGLEAYMMPGRAFQGAGITLPNASLFQKFGTNLLTFASADVSTAVSQGGGLGEAGAAVTKAIPTAALFTVAQAIPYAKLVQNPWLVKTLESVGAGGAFAGSAAISGESDPAELAVHFLTGLGLHAIASGKPQDQSVKGLEWEKFAEGWRTANKVVGEKWSQVKTILDAIGEEGSIGLGDKPVLPVAPKEGEVALGATQDTKTVPVKTHEAAQTDKEIIAAKLRAVSGGDPNAPLTGVTDSQAKQYFDVQIPLGVGQIGEGPRAPGEGLPDKTIGVNLSRLEVPGQIKEVIYRVAEANQVTIDEARRGEITNEETGKLAALAGMDIETLLKRQGGQAFNAEQALAARQLLSSSADQLFALAEKAAGPDASPLDIAIFRRQMSVHSAIQHEVAGMRAEAGRALQSFKILAGPEAGMTKQLSELINATGGEGLSKNMAEAILALKDNPEAMARVAAKSWKATKWDMFLEYYINGLLWSPTTHAANIVGNGIFLTGNVAERKLAGMWSSHVEIGEAEAMAHGIVEGFTDALRMTGQSLKAGGADIFGKVESRHGPAITSEMLGASGNVGRAVDLLGEVIRAPGRALGAEDAFFKSIAYRMELNALAHRTAMQEARDYTFFTGQKLTPEEIGRRMAEIKNDPPEDLHLEAQDFGRYVTFQNSMGKFGSAVTQATAICPALRLILPFVRTPGNIFRVALERTPFAPVLGQFRADVAAGGARRDLALTRWAAGSMVMGVFGTLAASGLVTGQGPEKKELKEAWERQGNQEYSIKIGDKWYGYDRLDPVGMALGMAADGAQFIGRIPEAESQNLVAMGVSSTIHALTSKTFMLQVGQILNAIKDPEHYGHQAVGSLAKGVLIPLSSLANSITSITDPGKKEVKDPRWAGFQTYVNELKSRVPWNPFSSETLPIERDRWGDHVIPQKAGGEWFGPVANAFSPIKVSEIQNSPVDAELLTHKSPMPMPSRIYKGVQMLPQEYDRLVELAGHEIKYNGKNLIQTLEQMVKSPDYQHLRGEGQDSPKMALLRTIAHKMFDEPAIERLRKEFPDFDHAVKKASTGHMEQQYGITIPGGLQ